MVTLFWYYRPEDTGIQSTDFQEVTLHIAMEQYSDVFYHAYNVPIQAVYAL